MTTDRESRQFIMPGVMTDKRRRFRRLKKIKQCHMQNRQCLKNAMKGFMIELFLTAVQQEELKYG